MKRPAGLVSAVLAEYGALVHHALREYLRGELPELYDLAADYPTRGGRSLRASLCIASARAFGASIEDALNSAVALELLHNAFLVHDDVEDESEERRGRPRCTLLHGVPIAVNVGDALACSSLRPLHREPPYARPRSPSACSRRPSAWRGSPSRGRRWSWPGAGTTRSRSRRRTTCG